MSFVAVYRRVLGFLAPERNVILVLIAANAIVAGLQFLDPVLFGRVIGLLATSDRIGSADLWNQAGALLGLWAAVGAAGIIANMAMVVQAERLAHRNRLTAMSRYFAHVLALPLSFHGDAHSGRLMKSMITGADSLFAVWLLFFREQLSTFICTLVLLPITLLMNWQLAIALITLVILFCIFAVLVIRKTETAQRRVEQYHSNLAGTAQDALANVMVVQSFTRLSAESRRFGEIVHELISNQFPVLNWWALVNVLTRASATITVIAIVIIGTILHVHGQATVAQIVSFMGIANLLIGRLEFGDELRLPPVLPDAAARGFLPRARRAHLGAGEARRHDAPHRARRGRVRGRLLRLSGRPEDPRRRLLHRGTRHGGGAGRPYRRRQIHRDEPAATPVGPDQRHGADRRAGHPRRRRSKACAPASAWCSRRACCSTARSARTF